jgi:hypothetical protein
MSLADLVVEQIKKDVLDGYLTAIEELVKAIPTDKLLGFLTEGVTA